MGREWYSGGRFICSSKSKRKSNEDNGCITALYHFFHSHRFYFPSRHHHHQPIIDSHSRTPKRSVVSASQLENLQSRELGLVAPLNSLELTDESPLSTNYKLGKESLNISVSGKNSTLRALFVDTSSNICNSPRTKTPNVVARLMGLDLLPDNLDLNRSSRYSVRGHRHSGNGSGTRSLPASPRISSDSDNRRLSLQLNKEYKHEEFGRWRLKESKQDDQSPSPRHNGRQIKERKNGMDITDLFENRRTGAAQKQVEHRKVRSRFSQRENTTSNNTTFVLKQDHQQPRKVSLSLSKEFKEKLKRVNEQLLIPINGWKPKADSESKFSPHPTPNNRTKQRKAFISISMQSNFFDPSDFIEKKKCKKICVASSAFSATERPRKQMKRAEEAERNADTTVSSGQMHKYEEKLPQEASSSSFCDSATLTSAGGSEQNLQGMQKLEEEEARVVAEIERHIVDSLVLETLLTTSFL